MCNVHYKNKYYTKSIACKMLIRILLQYWVTKSSVTISTFKDELAVSQ